ncbi:MAG TPA: GNAT family N-acetyltransferase [Gaiellaceae bacterium]|nr:GNAT family N-acetyltransferase [Gaiellaceae bacterium]
MIRRGGHPDLPFLRGLLRHAYHWRVNIDAAEIPIGRYVDRWGRPGDAAVIALEDGRPVGAAWFRLYPEGAPGYGFLDAATPELTIAVVPSKRGKGFGGELLEGLLERARAGGHERISLSVERDSDQERFYERHGFERAREDEGGAVTMAKRLQ